MAHMDAAHAAHLRNAAERALSDPRNVARSLRVTGAALAAGILTPEAIAAAAAVAASAPAPDPETVARLRSLLSITPTRGVVARGSRAAVADRRA